MNYKKTLSIFLSFLFIFLIFAEGFGSLKVAAENNTIYAETSSSKSVMNEKHDVKIISESFNSAEYTFQENGKVYKVNMKFNNDKTEIDNDVYVKNDDGSYEFVRESNLIFNEKSKEATITENGKAQRFDLDNDDFSASKINIYNGINASIAPNSYNDLGPWVHHSTTFIRQDIKGMALELIVSLIFSRFIPKTAVAAAVSSLLKAHGSNAFWAEQKWAYKYIKGLNPPLPRGERIITTIYMDKEKTSKVGLSDYTYNYTSGYEP